MSGAWTGSRQIADPPRWCREIAGLLAEQSIVHLDLTDAQGHAHSLTTRQTDLPGILLRSIPCTLSAHKPFSLTIVVRASDAEWACDDEEFSLALRSTPG